MKLCLVNWMRKYLSIFFYYFMSNKKKSIFSKIAKMKIRRKIADINIDCATLGIYIGCVDLVKSVWLVLFGWMLL